MPQHFLLFILLLLLISDVSAQHHFVVNDTLDTEDANPGDGECKDINDKCTFRAALDEANVTISEPDTISFNIPGCDTCVIFATAQNPSDRWELTKSGTIIDATLSDSNYFIGKYRLDGSTMPDPSARILVIEGDDCEVYGLHMVNAPDAAIEIKSANVVIGRPGKGNVLARSENGIRFGGATGAVIQSNYIGTDLTGTVADGNVYGVYFETSTQNSNNLIGGHLSDKGNLISGNTCCGIYMDGGHYQNAFISNFIGTNTLGVLNLGNTARGIYIASGAPSDNFFFKNTIAFNGSWGIDFRSGAGNRISQNKIYCNGQQGIYFENTANNNKDSATIDSAKTHIIYGNSEVGDTVEVFVTHQCIDCDPGQEEGEIYVGVAVADSSGNWTLPQSKFVSGVTLTEGDMVTATASDPDGNTSEFSACKEVEQGHSILTPEIEFTGSICLGDMLLLTNTTSYMDDSISYSWETPNGSLNAETDTLLIDMAGTEDEGEYSLRVMINGIYSAYSDTVVVSVLGPPNDVMNDTFLINDAVVELDVIANDLLDNLPSWTISLVTTPDLGNLTLLNSNHFQYETAPDQETGSSFQYRICNEQCPDLCDTAEVILVVNPLPAVQVPEGLTLNDDGLNDELIIDGLEFFSKRKILIFNRWGEVVWEGDPHANRWKGTNQDGKTLPMGAYYYMLKLDNEAALKGIIYLVN